MISRVHTTIQFQANVIQFQANIYNFIISIWYAISTGAVFLLRLFFLFWLCLTFIRAIAFYYFPFKIWFAFLCFVFILVCAFIFFLSADFCCCYRYRGFVTLFALRFPFVWRFHSDQRSDFQLIGCFILSNLCLF